MAETIIDRCCDWFGRLFGRRKPEAETKLDEDIDQLLNQLDPLIRDIFVKYHLRNLKDDLLHLNVLLKDFGGISTEVSKVLSLLITEAEKYWGDTRGADKKAFVIEAFIRLFKRYNIDLPDIPEFMEEP